ncbi:Hypothetical protein ING2D1G_1498 [Peptoniphilus sp. ING2-D1G]|nr:Hypothetical protein ING2D1G_1498 [Peptoniphilus sp. ING2-D1G]
MSIPERIKKIEKMEKILDEHNLRLGRLKKALDEFKQHQKEYSELKDYYLKGEYLRDVESFDKGEFPTDLKCGVLSEDAVFNLIGDNFNMAVEMLEVATAIIKAH